MTADDRPTPEWIYADIDDIKTFDFTEKFPGDHAFRLDSPDDPLVRMSEVEKAVREEYGSHPPLDPPDDITDAVMERLKDRPRVTRDWIEAPTENTHGH